VWEIRYLDQNPSHVLRTANEIHIPIGEPVMVHLMSADVIHSFWVPSLSGKTDAIPGQTNVLWIEASRPGRYRGQCSEFCGAQHAHMGFYVVANDPNRYRDWYNNQLEGAAAPAAEIQQGKAIFDSHCGICHAVRGTIAGGILGPDLSGITMIFLYSFPVLALSIGAAYWYFVCTVWIVIFFTFYISPFLV
jgi:cytochrome c oxidase subunit 2